MGDLINVYDVVKTTPTSHTPPWRQLANCVRLYSTNSHIVAKNPLQCASMQILIFRALCTLHFGPRLGMERYGKINAVNSCSESWTGIGVVAGCCAVMLIMQ
jgi:hypothetical protein